MADPVYSIAVEFVTGSFTEVGSDCLHFTANRTLADLWDSIAIGKMSMQMDNFDGKYSPDTSSGPYIGLLKTNKRVRAQATYTGSVFPIFNGYITRYVVSPNLGQRTVLIEAEDLLSKIQRRELDSSLFTNTNAGSLFVNVLSIAGLNSSEFAVSSLNDTISFSWLDNQRPFSVLQNLVDFGYYQLYNGSDGKINVNGRYQQLEAAATGSYTSFLGFGSTLDEQRIYNDIKIAGQPRKQSSSVNTVAWIQDVPSIAASSSIGFFLSYVDPINIIESGTPANSLVTPVSSSDYLTNVASDGSGSFASTATTSASVTFFAASAVCSVFNGSGNLVYLTKFQLRGNSVQKQPAISYKSQDSSSQNVYGRKGFTLTNDLINLPAYAKDYGDFLIDILKEPIPKIEMELKNVFPDILQRELGQVINTTENNTAVNTNCIIRSIEHDVTFARGLEHSLRMDIWPKQIGDYLILNHPTFGKIDNRKLGF